MLLFFLVLFAALVFEYINGFHDTANSIATVVSTKVLTPRQAVAWAAFWNLIGALAGAILWKLLTWWLGLPSSSSHALIGGLCGSALATAHDKWGVLIW